MHTGVQLSRVGDVSSGCHDGRVSGGFLPLSSDSHHIHIRGLSVGIYLTSNTDACQYIAHDCQANIIVVENGHQMNKILTCRHELPHLKVIINCSKDGNKSEENVMDVSQLMY